MKPDLKTRRKQLLKDPVTAFMIEATNRDKDQIGRLGTLWEQHSTIKANIKLSQNQKRLISKKIGEAKRNGNSIEPLKQQMQKHSSQSKALTGQLQEIEEQILSFFNLENSQVNTQKMIATNLCTCRYDDSQVMDKDIIISLLETEHAEWNTYVENNPAASIYHRIEWRELIYQTFGHKGIYLHAKDSQDKIVGVLPLIHLQSRLFGNFLVSMPYFNYGGAVADHPLIEQKLMTIANEHASRLGLSHIEYRDDIERSDYPAKTDKVNMILTLPDDKNTLWNNFSSKLRAQIKRPQRENPEILRGSTELLSDFYTVFARNMRDLGTPVYGRSFFANILNCFPEQSSIIVLRLHKRPVAAAFLLGHRETLEIPWASTIKEVNHLSLNMLLYWEVLKFAIRDGYQYFDFGRSSKGAGTYRFKQQWGAIPKQLYWHYWLENHDELPSLNPSNPKYALAIKLWKCLPLTLSKLLGPLIVKNLP